MDISDDDSGYAEWVNSEVTRFIVKQYSEQLAGLMRELSAAAVGTGPREAIAVIGGRIAAYRAFLKTLSGGKF